MKPETTSTIEYFTTSLILNKTMCRKIYIIKYEINYMFLIIIKLYFSSTRFVSHSWSNGSTNTNNFPTTDRFMDWFFQDGLSNMMNQPVNNLMYKQNKFSECEKLSAKKRDKCYHDVANKHRKKGPLSRPVFDNDGHLILFETIPDDESSNSDSDETYSRENGITTKKIKIKQHPNGEKEISVEKKDNMQDNIYPNVLRKYPSAFKKHGLESQHGQSENSRKSNDSSDFDIINSNSSESDTNSNKFDIPKNVQENTKKNTMLDNGGNHVNNLIASGIYSNSRISPKKFQYLVSKNIPFNNQLLTFPVTPYANYSQKKPHLPNFEMPIYLNGVDPQKHSKKALLSCF